MSDRVAPNEPHLETTSDSPSLGSDLEWYHVVGIAAGLIGAVALIGWVTKKSTSSSGRVIGKAPRDPSGPSPDPRRPIAVPSSSEADVGQGRSPLDHRVLTPGQKIVVEDTERHPTRKAPVTPTPKNSPLGSLSLDSPISSGVIKFEETDSEEEDDDDELGPGGVLYSPLELTEDVVILGQFPLSGGVLLKEYLLPVGDGSGDMVVFFVVPQSVALSHVAIIPQLEKRFPGGLLRVLENFSQPDVLDGKERKGDLVFKFDDTVNGFIGPLPTIMRGQVIVLRFKGIQGSIQEDTGSVSMARFFGFPVQVAPAVPPSSLNFDPFGMKKIAAAELVPYSDHLILQLTMFRSLLLIQSEDEADLALDARVKKFMQSIASSRKYKKTIPIMFHVPRGELGRGTREMLNIEGTKTALSIMQFTHCYNYAGDFSDADITKFLETFHRSEPTELSPVVRDPSSTNLLLLFSKNFPDIVLKPDSGDVLVCCFPGEGHHRMTTLFVVRDMAAIYEGTALKIAFFDSLTSVPPKEDFPDRSEAYFVLYHNGVKKAVYEGQEDETITVESLINFVAENTSLVLDVEALRLKARDRLLAGLDLCESDMEITHVLAHAPKEDPILMMFLSPSPEAQELLTLASRLRSEISSAPNAPSLNLVVIPDYRELAETSKKFDIKANTLLVFIGGIVVQQLSQFSAEDLVHVIGSLTEGM